MAVAVSATVKDLLGPDDLVRDVGQLPASPAVLPQLMSLLNDSSASLDEVVDLILLDAGMAARMLQVANSAFYGRGARCEVIEEAVNRIGFLKTYELVSFAAASRLFMQPLISYGITAEELWRRSVTGAIASEILARRCDTDASLSYTAGLLHAIGLVVIDTWARNQPAGPRLSSTGYPRESISQELSTLGFTNASVASALLRSWKFPEAMTEPIRWQFDPKAAAPRHQPVACVLSAAKWLRDAVPAAAAGEALPRYPDDWILQRLRLNGSELESLVEETRGSFAEATQLLIEMGTRPESVHLRMA